MDSGNEKLLAELPPNTFSLAAQEVPEFVIAVAERFDISDPVAEICTAGLSRQFELHGGYSEQPPTPEAVWMPYHNGSHSVCAPVNNTAALMRPANFSKRAKIAC